MRPDVGPLPETPLAALESLDRELASMCADVAHPGSMLGERLDALLKLLPVVTEAANQPEYAADHDATVATLQRMHRRHEELAAALRGELARVREELSHVNTSSRATRSYGAAPQRSGSTAFDRIG